jgi:predicted AlkP superfamily phosphohydrolase/phosphomutase/tetratricopeptide (TPR) repeat protein
LTRADGWYYKNVSYTAKKNPDHFAVRNDLFRKRKLLLVGWDAADWKVISPLVDQGLMPHTQRLVENGMMGNLATLAPILSPMLWTSIATGKRPYKHGVHGFIEPDPHTHAVRPITNLSRKTKAVWNILNQEDKKSFVVGWWPSHPAEPIRGAMVSNHFQQAVAPLHKPWPIRAGTVHPPELVEELAPLRIHPHELEGDMLCYFVPRAPEIDQQKDQRLAMVAKIVAECSSIHAAATHLIGHQRDWDFAAVYYDSIDHFGHGFMRYHPPRLEWISEEDFELYKGVVDGGYIYHDMMLGALLELAGPETTVILMSDHGFHPDHLRPKSTPNEPAGPAAEHRQIGIFVACGPGIKQDDLVFGASVLDITPTMLSLFGLPVGRDMDGRALTAIYEVAPDVAYIDSWDAVPGDAGRHPPEMQIDPVDAREAIRQLVHLGYIEEPDEDASKAAEEATRELRYNLARAYVDGGKAAEGADIFSALWDRWPEESRFGVHLLQAEIDLGHVLEARETMTLLRKRKSAAAESAAEELKALLEKTREQHPLDTDGDDSDPDRIDWEAVSDQEKRRFRRLRGRAGTNLHAFAFLEGSLLHLEGRYDEALRVLGLAVGAQTNDQPSLYLKLGEVCVSKRDWAAATEHYRKVVELDPLSALAHFGLARVAVNQRAWETAAQEALTAAGQHYHYAPSHFMAGLALWHLGKHDESLDALRRAVAINPVYPAAHRTLASYFLNVRRDWIAYDHHRRLAREAKRRIATFQAIGSPEDQHPQEYRETFGSGDPTEEEFLQLNELTVGSPTLPPFDQTIVVVTGLPRSGTSMMMQMLHAGGLPVLVDDHRPADESNQRGYFEHARAKQLARDASWLAGSNGKAVKIVAQLVPHLPTEHRYRLIMMHRPLEEIVNSQKKMLQRLGRDGATITDWALMHTYQRQVTHVRALLAHLRRRGVLDVLDVKYHDALQNPASVAAAVAEFLDCDFDSTRAAAAVDSTLRHECG